MDVKDLKPLLVHAEGSGGEADRAGHVPGIHRRSLSSPITSTSIPDRFDAPGTKVPGSHSGTNELQSVRDSQRLGCLASDRVSRTRPRCDKTHTATRAPQDLSITFIHANGPRDAGGRSRTAARRLARASNAAMPLRHDAGGSSSRSRHRRRPASKIHERGRTSGQEGHRLQYLLTEPLITRDGGVTGHITAPADQRRERCNRNCLAPVRAPARDVTYPAATDIRDTRAGQTVVIVVGSSSHATHHMAGSVPVSLNRYSPCSS